MSAGLTAMYRRLEAPVLDSLPPSQHWRGRIAVGTSVGLAPWGLFFAIVFFAIGKPSNGVSLLLAALIVGAGPALIPRLGLPTVGILMSAGLTQSLILPALYTRGLSSGSIPWMVVGIVMSFLLSGRTAGIAWTALCVVLMGIGAVIEGVGVVPIGPGVPDDVALFLTASANSGLFIVVGAVSAVALASVEQQRLALAHAVHQADQANVAKSTFLARMSHELRTPLNAILGYSELLAEDASPQDTEDLDRISTSGRALLELVNDILDLSKVEAGELELLVQPVDVRPLAQQVAAQIQPVFDVPLEVQVAEVACLADPKRLRQCLVNLLSNAARFAEGQPVTLACERQQDLVVFRVVDRGAGMAPDTLDAIFEPFVQVHTGDRGGTGLGLAIVRQLVHGMGGTITVDSAPNQGSTFEIRLPAA